MEALLFFLRNMKRKAKKIASSSPRVLILVDGHKLELSMVPAINDDSGTCSNQTPFVCDGSGSGTPVVVDDASGSDSNPVVDDSSTE